MRGKLSRPGRIQDHLSHSSQRLLDPGSTKLRKGISGKQLIGRRVKELYENLAPGMICKNKVEEDDLAREPAFPFLAKEYGQRIRISKPCRRLILQGF